MLCRVNVECLEGLFDTWGTFGRGFVGNLSLGGAELAHQAPQTPLHLRLAYSQDMYTRHIVWQMLGVELRCKAVDASSGNQ